MESGNVYLPHPAIAPWVEAFVEECSTFPNGKYDDQVDQMMQEIEPAARRHQPREEASLPAPATAQRRPQLDEVRRLTNNGAGRPCGMGVAAGEKQSVAPIASSFPIPSGTETPRD